MLKFLGYFGLLADIVTIVVFINNMKFAEFWTRQWILSICLILVLFLLAMAIIKISSNNENEINLIMGGFGVGYTILGIILFIFFAHTQTSSYIDIQEYLGYWVLFSIMYIIGLYCVLKISVDSVIFQSYAYGAAVLYIMILLIYKYVFNNEAIDLPTLLQEILILIVGSLILFIPLTIFKDRINPS